MSVSIFRAVLWIVFLSFTGTAQIGPVHFIDSSAHSVGISKIVSADLDNNGTEDIIASFSGSNGKLAYYLNQGGNSFSSVHIVDSVPFTTGVATGDFNSDGWTDIVSIGGTGMQMWVYFSSAGSFTAGVSLDSAISIAVNDIEVWDFDGNGSDDIIVIGQHSIDLHRNNGNGTFTKEEILTTSSSPRPLECLDLALADVNTDGNMDLICGETAGLVVYINSGTGVFSPHYYSSAPEIVHLVQPMDIDGDGNMDVLQKNSFGEIKWFSNDGSGVMTYEAILTSLPDLHSFLSVDANGDGAPDIYATYLHHASVFLNDANHQFNAEVPVYQNNALYMDAIHTTDINSDGSSDYLWAGTSRSLAYHLHTGSTGTWDLSAPPAPHIYPNPATGYIIIENPSYSKTDVAVYNFGGQLVREYSGVRPGEKINISSLNAGVYLLKVKGKPSDYSARLIVQ